MALVIGQKYIILRKYQLSLVNKKEKIVLFFVYH